MIHVEGIWRHEFPDEPVLLFSELDDERYETRKVEVFRDGRVLRASESHRADYLAEGVYPTVEEVNADPQSEGTLREVTVAVFEAVWELAGRAERGSISFREAGGTGGLLD